MVLTDLAWRFVAVEDVDGALELGAVVPAGTTPWHNWLQLMAQVRGTQLSERQKELMAGMRVSPTAWGTTALRELLMMEGGEAIF